MPTGGVDTSEENLKVWVGAKATCVGMGSKLITNDIIKNKDYKLLKKNVKEVLSIIIKVRKV